MSSETCHRHSTYEPLSETQYDVSAALFSALGDPERLKIVHLLVEGGQCVGYLAEVMGSSMSSVSQRLRILHAANLIVREKRGKHVFYSLADEHVAALLRNGIEHATTPRCGRAVGGKGT